jgi:hypothetical protein
VADRPDYGSVISPEGVLRYLSPSSLEKADHESEKGCIRRWLYHYAFGIREEQTKAQEAGTILHAGIETYLTTGRKQLPQQAVAGLPMIPPPGPGLLIEHPMTPPPDPAGGAAAQDAALASAILRPGDVPMIGFIDLLNQRGLNYGGQDVLEISDPPKTIEVLDWKTTKNMKYAKKGSDLIHTIQMSSYGKYAIKLWPDTQHVRLSHGYFPNTGVPVKRTARHSTQEIHDAFVRVDALARKLKQVALVGKNELAVHDVDANPGPACHAYNRPCPAIKQCRASMQNGLGTVVAGEDLRGAFDFMDDPEPQKYQPPVPQKTPQEPPKPMSEDQKTDEPAPKKPGLFSRMRSAQPDPKAAQTASDQAALQKLKQLQAIGLGRPALAGELAQMIARAEGLDFRGDGMPGFGTLGEATLHEVKLLDEAIVEATEMARQLEAEDGEGAQGDLREAPSLLPPDAPESDPGPTAAALAAKKGKASAEDHAAGGEGMSVEDSIAAMAEGETGMTATKRRGGRPPGSKNKPKAGAEAPAQTPAQTPVAPRLSEQRVEVVVPPQTEQQQQERVVNAINTPPEISAARFSPPAQPAPASQVTPTIEQRAIAAQADGSITLYVNCEPLSGACEGFAPLVSDKLELITARYGGTEGERDYRTGPSDHVKFMKFRGVLAELLRDAFKRGEIPPGRYKYRAMNGSDIAAAVAEAMEPICRATGGDVVVGHG